MKAHQAEENIHPLQFGTDFFVPAVTGFEFCVVPRLKNVHVRLYSQHGKQPFVGKHLFFDMPTAATETSPLRVSSESDRQITDLQRDALLAAGVDGRLTPRDYA